MARPPFIRTSHIPLGLREPDEGYEECDHCGDNALDGEAWQCKCNGDRIFCGETCFDKWHTIQRRVCETVSIEGS